MERTLKYCEYDYIMESQKWIQQIPFIRFKRDWSVRVMPPFWWAIIRFCIEKGDNSASVYLDCYDSLWIVGRPYWEVYGNLQPERCAMEDIEWLLKIITNHLKPIKKMKYDS